LQLVIVLVIECEFCVDGMFMLSHLVTNVILLAMEPTPPSFTVGLSFF